MTQKAFELRIPSANHPADLWQLLQEQYPGVVDRVGVARLTARFSYSGEQQEVVYDFPTPPEGMVLLVPHHGEIAVSPWDQFRYAKSPLPAVLTLEVAERGDPL